MIGVWIQTFSNQMGFAKKIFFPTRPFIEDLLLGPHTLNSEIKNFHAQNCAYEGGGVTQSIAAEGKQRYTLKTTAKVSQNNFDAFVGMTFFDDEGNVLGNPIKKLIYNTEFQEIILSVISPPETRTLKVWFKKEEGDGCLVTRDWCLTSTAGYVPPLENTLMLKAWRNEYISELVLV